MIDAPWPQLNDRCAAFGQVSCTSSLFKEQATLFKEQVVPMTCQNGRIDHLAGAHRSFSKLTSFKYAQHGDCYTPDSSLAKLLCGMAAAAVVTLGKRWCGVESCPASVKPGKGTWRAE